jgi:hypothetical protein
MTPNRKAAEQETFAQHLQKMMDEHDPPMGIMETSDALQTSYEHVRKMVRGIIVPTRFVVLALAQLFDADPNELETIANRDRFNRKFGANSPTPIFNPEVMPFATAWPMLSDAQKAELLSTLKKMVAANSKKVNRAS